MLSHRHLLPIDCPEKCTYTFEFDLEEPDGTPIPSAGLSSLTLTLYNFNDSSIINSVSGVNILNTGRGTVDSDGHVIIKLLPADNPMVAPSTYSQEKRIARVDWTYNAGVDAGKLELVYSVINLTLVS